MPIDVTGVGYSGHTDDKQEFFRSLVGIHLTMTYGVLSKWQPSGRYYYFDLHAGPGIHPEYGTGSPLIFCEVAQRFTTSHPAFKYQALMVEENESNRNSLQAELNRRGCWNATARLDDNRVVLQEYANPRYKNSFGLFYLDPTKAKDMHWDDLAACVNNWRKADVLIRIAAASFKRVQHLNDYAPLRDYLAGIDKETKCIMEPNGKHQWTFLYLTNGRPIIWKKRKFYDVDSPEGICAWDRITKTNRGRRDDDQPSLFNL